MAVAAPLHLGAAPETVGSSSPDLARVLVIPEQALRAPLGPGRLLEIYGDPTGEAPPAHVAGLPFLPAPPGTPNYGFTETIFYARLAVRNQGIRRELLLQVEYPLLDLIDLWYCAGPHRSAPGADRLVQSALAQCSGGTLTHQRAGDRLAFGARAVSHRTFLFPIQLPPGDSVFYFRFESSGTQQFPIQFTTLELLRQRDTAQTLALGIYYGILLVLSLYNLVLYFIVRDRSYLFYLLYITGYGMIQLNLNGLAYEYFWPESPVWANISLPAFIGWAFIWATQFSRSFLNTAELAQRTNSILLGLMAAFGVLLFSAFLLPYSWNIYMSAVLVIGFSVSVLLATLRLLQIGFRPARYFLLAWFSLLLGVTIFAMKGLGWLPATFVTEYGLQIGSALEMGLLSLGLADRIHLMQVEKDRAARHALELEQDRRAAELQAARLEIELLKKNVEPHFLLNSINAVMVWLAEDPRNAARLLQALADELRILLSLSSRPTITVGEEINLCRTHLELMSLRHDKSFALEATQLVDEELLPPLIFHTIIENGLSHGFQDREVGMFRISRLEVDGRIQYTLENDGSREHGVEGTGLGLRYVRTRLEEAFPKRWKLEDGPGEIGWRTTISIYSKAERA